MEDIKRTHQIIRKNKEGSLFPKLSKVPIQSYEKSGGKNIIKKYGAQSIFKYRPEKQIIKPLKIAHEINEEHVIRSKQYQQVQNQICVSRQTHLEEMNNLHKVYQGKDKEISQTKKQIYKSKLSLWELKSQILNLKASLQGQDETYHKLLQELGYEQEQLNEQQNRVQQNGLEVELTNESVQQKNQVES